MIFVDTSFWVALLNPRNTGHGEAQLLLERFADQALVTSNHIRGETWTFLRRRAGHRAAVAFLDAVERSPRLRVANIPPVLEDEALRWLRQHDERECDGRQERLVHCAVHTLGVSRSRKARDQHAHAGED